VTSFKPKWPTGVVRFTEQGEHERGFSDVFRWTVVPKLRAIEATSIKAKTRSVKLKATATVAFVLLAAAVTAKWVTSDYDFVKTLAFIFPWVWSLGVFGLLVLFGLTYTDRNRDTPLLGFRRVLSLPEYHAAGHIAEILMEAVGEFYGEMSYRQRGEPPFDIRRFDQSGLLFVAPRVVYSIREPEWGNGDLSARCSDRLEGRHNGVNYAATNAAVFEDTESEDPRVEDERRLVFDGWLLEIDAPAPFHERFHIFNKGKVVDVSGTDAATKILNGEPIDVHPELVSLLGDTDVVIGLFEGKLLIAAEINEKPFASAARLVEDASNIEAVAHDFLRDAGRPARIIDMLGWHNDTTELPVWDPSWAEAERLQAEKKAEREADLTAGIKLAKDGTYAVGSRTFKSRADAQAFVDLRTRTQSWAE